MAELPKIVRQRLAAETPGEHPDAGLLTAFTERSLPAAERRQVTEHLARCADCREVLALSQPPVEEALPAPAPRTWWGWPMLRWSAMSASVAIIIAVVLVVQQPDKGGDVAPLVIPPAAPSADIAAKVSEPETEALTAAESAAATPAAAPGRQAASGSPYRAGAKEAGAKEDDVARAEQQQRVQAPGGSTQTYAALDRLERRRKAEVAAPGIAGGVADMAKAAPAAPPPPAEAVERHAREAAEPAAPAEEVERDRAIAARQEPALSDLRADAAKDEQAQREMEVAESKVAQNAVADTANMKLQPAPAKSMSQPVVVGFEKPGVRWAVMPEGKLARSADGATWREVEVAPQTAFRAVGARDKLIWALATDGYLWRSDDAGESWTRAAAPVPVDEPIVRIDVLSARELLLTAKSGARWRSKDAGTTWERLQPE